MKEYFATIVIECPYCKTVHPQFFGLDQAIFCRCGACLWDIGIAIDGDLKMKGLAKGDKAFYAEYLRVHGQDDTRAYLGAG